MDQCLPYLNLKGIGFQGHVPVNVNGPWWDIESSSFLLSLWHSINICTESALYCLFLWFSVSSVSNLFLTSVVIAPA